MKEEGDFSRSYAEDYQGKNNDRVCDADPGKGND